MVRNAPAPSVFHLLPSAKQDNSAAAAPLAPAPETSPVGPFLHLDLCFRRFLSCFTRQNLDSWPACRKMRSKPAVVVLSPGKVFGSPDETSVLLDEFLVHAFRNVDFADPHAAMHDVGCRCSQGNKARGSPHPSVASLFDGCRQVEGIGECQNG